MLDRGGLAGLGWNRPTGRDAGGIELIIVVRRASQDGARVGLQLLVGGSLQKSCRAGLQLTDVCFRDDAFMPRGGLFGRIGAFGIGVGPQAASIQDDQLAISQGSRSSGIPTRWNEPVNISAGLRDIHHRDRIGVGACHVQLLSIRAQGQRAGRHAQWVPRSHRHVDRFQNAQALARGDANGVDVIRVGCGDEQAAHKRRFALDWLHGAGTPYDVGRMGRQTHGFQ